MRLIAEDLTMQDLKGVIADAKAEAARSANWSGVKLGTLVTLLLTGTVLALFFGIGLLQFTPTPSNVADQTVAPPLVKTGPIGAPQGGPPAPMGQVPPLPVNPK